MAIHVVSGTQSLTLGAHAHEGYGSRSARKPGHILLYEGEKKGGKEEK